MPLVRKSLPGKKGLRVVVLARANVKGAAKVPFFHERHGALQLAGMPVIEGQGHGGNLRARPNVTAVNDHRLDLRTT